jgi:hypothetical protein
MLAGFQRGEGYGRMQEIRYNHHHGIQLRMFGEHLVVIAVRRHGFSIDLQTFLEVLGSDIAESHHLDLGKVIAKNWQVRTAGTGSGPNHAIFPRVGVGSNSCWVGLRQRQARGPCKRPFQKFSSRKSLVSVHAVSPRPWSQKSKKSESITSRSLRGTKLSVCEGRGRWLASTPSPFRRSSS